MKIENSYNPALVMNTGNKKNAEKAAEKSDAPASSDVTLSSLTTSMSSGDQAAPVNSARIAELKAAIASGQFKIDANAIAGRLLDTAKELVQSQRQA